MFIPRISVVEDQFCSYDEQTDTGSTGIGGVVAYAGSVIHLVAGATNEEAMVSKVTHANASTDVPFGLLMQKVKTGYHDVHPSGYYMPGDLGSSDVIAQPKYNNSGTITGTKAAPVGVAHLGIWDTVHYTCHKSEADGVSTVITKMSPGLPLVAAADQGKLTTQTAADSIGGDGVTDAAVGAVAVNIKALVVARVVKGASAAKCQANVDNMTLYPIRVKLVV